MKKHLIWLLSGVVLAALAACDSDTPDANTKVGTQVADVVEQATDVVTASEADRLNQWFEVQYETELSMSPIGLTMQGRKERYDEIDDFSDEVYAEQVAWKAASVAEMKAKFNYDALNDDAKLSWDLWKFQNEQTKASYAMRHMNYVFEQMNGTHSFLPTFLISFHKVESMEDMQAFTKRVTAVGKGIDQLIVHAKANAKKGVRPPRFAYEIVIEEVEKILTGQPFTDDTEDAPLWADAKSEVAALLEKESIDQAQAEQLLAAAKTAINGEFKTGYQNLLAFLQADIANTTEVAQGVGALPGGEAYYNHRLKMMTTTEMTADQIHQLGLSEVTRLRAEMEVLKEKAEFSGTLGEFFTFLRDSRDDDRLYYPETDEGRQGYIDDATAAIENIKAQLPNYFGILPKADLEVRRVESFREQDGAPQHYFSGTPDGSRPGIYYAHLSDMSAMPKNQLEVIAYHEGLPGHHMQISIAQELEGVPTFRTQAGFTAYAEGWGLYSELLAKEMPDTYVDVYSDFGRLTSEIWRAIRLVVDSGMHSKGWSQQQAVDYFATNSPAPLPAIEAEVRRYLVIPGQATAYKVGMLDILRLRKLAEGELGDAFDIREFHDVILGGGSLPLSLLDRKVKRWIAESKTVG